MPEDWLRCVGLRPRLYRWLKQRFGWAWVDRTILARAAQQIEDEQVQAVLSTCWNTGKIVTGTVDDEGVMTLTVHDEEGPALR